MTEINYNHSIHLECPASSKTSLKVNQTFDMNSLSTSERGRSPSVPSDATTVIFADDVTSNHIRKASSYLHCLNYDFHQMYKQDNNTNNIDDFGAPLASPETLSEISSISSEHYIKDLQINLFEENVTDFESQLHTPKIMRRALKFTENLSLCANDKRNVDQYKRLGRVFITNPLKNIQPCDNQSFSSKDSYESDSMQFENFKSADNIDNDIEKSTIDNKLTVSDSTFINKMQDCLRQNIKQFSPIMDSKYKFSSSDTFYSAKSSIEKIKTTKDKTNEYTVQNQATGILESHFPVYTTHTFHDKEEKLYSFTTNYSNMKNENSPNSIYSRKIYKNIEKKFVLNESLPLLSNLSEKNRPTQALCKRKGCVYPETLVGNKLHDRPLSKSESNV